MPVTIPEEVTATQNDWRFCAKCLSLFWNGLDHNGHCAGGGAHQAISWDFYLLGNPTAAVSQPPNEPTGP